MAVLKRLTNLLEKAKVKYEIIKHKTVYTAMDKAETLHINPKNVAKTVVVKIGKGKHILALIPANKNLDKVQLKKTINNWLKKTAKAVKVKKAAETVKEINFATEAWMRKNIKGKIGATPPFGKLFKMPTFIDRSLLRAKKLIINTGDYEHSIEIPSKQIEKVESLIKGSFSKIKKKIKSRPR